MLRCKRLNKPFFRSLDPNKPKQFWKAVKALNKGKSLIHSLNHDGVTADSDVDKANMLNQYFSMCFCWSHPPLVPEDHKQSQLHFLMNFSVMLMK